MNVDDAFDASGASGASDAINYWKKSVEAIDERQNTVRGNYADLLRAKYPQVYMIRRGGHIDMTFGRYHHYPNGMMYVYHMGNAVLVPVESKTLTNDEIIAISEELTLSPCQIKLYTPRNVTK
jgi:hypothetical protein